MNYRSFFIPVLAGICLSACTCQHQLTPQELEEYARYVRNHDSAAAKLRNAAKQATEIVGELTYYENSARKTTRVPMSKEEQDVVRRLFAGVESPPLLPQTDWYEYQQYERNMIHPSTPLCFCDIVFLAADGSELAAETLFESPWTDIGDKKNADNYRKFESGHDPCESPFNAHYIPQLFAEQELIQQYHSLPVMNKLKQLADDCYAGR